MYWNTPLEADVNANKNLGVQNKLQEDIFQSEISQGKIIDEMAKTSEKSLQKITKLICQQRKMKRGQISST